MTEHGSDEELLQEILANPNDDQPRLVYARRLRDCGNPLGEFILAQCEVEKACKDRRPPHAGRPQKYEELRGWADELLAKHKEEWIRPLRGLGVQEVHYERGFPDWVVIDPDSFTRNAVRIFQLAPSVRRLTLDHLSGKSCSENLARAVAASPFLERVESLTLHGQWGDEAVQHLASSAHLDRLRDLTILPDARVGSAGLLALLRSPRLHSLEELRVAGASIGLAGAEALSSLGWIVPPIKRLSLQDVGLDGPAARALAESDLLSNLAELDLFDNPLGESGIMSLLRSPALSNTFLLVDTLQLPPCDQRTVDRRLNLHNNRLTPRGREPRQVD
jgi:uncharacterized protein (TIGR02996 family)